MDKPLRDLVELLALLAAIEQTCPPNCECMAEYVATVLAVEYHPN